MNRFIVNIELKEVTAPEFEHVDKNLRAKSFIADKSHYQETPGKCNRTGSYIRKGKDISLNDVSSLLLNTLYKTGRKYSFTIVREKTI